MDEYNSKKKLGVKNYRNKKIKSCKKNKSKLHRSKISSGKLLRNKFKQEINILLVKENYDTFIHPFKKNETTYTWWDCKPYNPKIY